MRFVNPWWLVLLVLVPLLWWWYQNRRVNLRFASLGVMRQVARSRWQPLKHATLASTVPYTATVNGTAVTLTGTSQVLIQQVSGATAAQGVVYDVKITIGSTTGALAGNYADAITVTVTQF